MGKKDGKHIKKKKNAPGSRMVIVFGSIAVIYFAAQMIWAMTDVETVSATRVSVDDAISATGYFIRSETVIPGTTGDTVEHAVHSGEKVKTGTRLAMEYADQAALQSSREMKQIDDQIVLLQSALQSAGDLADTAKLDQLITIRMQSLSGQVKHGMVADVSEDSAALRKLVLRRGMSGQDAATIQQEISTLTARKTSLQQTVNARTNVITSPCGGYFSETVDGYETILTAQEIDALSVETLQDKLKIAATPDTAALGKVMQGFEWHFATIVASEDAKGMEQGNEIKLRFSQMADDVDATVYAVRPGLDTSKTLLIFKSSVIRSELVSMRRQVVDIVRGSYTGIKVPKSAIRMDGEKMGVFTLSGSVSNFKEIQPLYEGDTFYVIQQGKTDQTGVVVQDNIIVKARGITDKKVVK